MPKTLLTLHDLTLIDNAGPAIADDLSGAPSIGDDLQLSVANDMPSVSDDAPDGGG